MWVNLYQRTLPFFIEVGGYIGAGAAFYHSVQETQEWKPKTMIHESVFVVSSFFLGRLAGLFYPISMPIIYILSKPN